MQGYTYRAIGDAHLEMLRVKLGSSMSHMINAGLTGNASRARALVMSSGSKAGLLPLAAYGLRVLEPGYSEIIETAWMHNDESVKHYLGKHYRTRMRRLLRAGNFPVSGLPKEDFFRIYRGASNVSRAKAAEGLSWSLCYESACWFALKSHKPKPIVVSALVSAKDVLFHCTKVGEDEIILHKAPKAARYGDIAYWRAAYSQKEAAKKARSGKVIVPPIPPVPAKPHVHL